MKGIQAFTYILVLIIFIMTSVIHNDIQTVIDSIRPCPNCRLKDSLYLKCNSQIKAYNGDSLMHTKQDNINN